MSEVERKAWTRDELILAVNLYCKTPFGRIHMQNPEIIELAKRLGRSPGSVSYKLANFASLDPSLPRKGASNYSKLDRKVWNEFYENWEAMAFESERLTAAAENRPLEEMEEEPFAEQEGKEREVVTRVRVNQGFFRRMILAAYDGACCISGLQVTGLLVASHIVPWSVDANQRMNPRNGLCLNALHDRAFDLGLITLDEDCRVVVSKRSDLIENREAEREMILKYEGQTIMLPRRFIPDEKLLAYHREKVFCG